MFVIIDDSLPDIRVLTYEEMVNQLIAMPNCMAYEYTLKDGVWHVNRRFMTIDVREVVYNDVGMWGCLPEYLTYSVPNLCSECKMEEFMKGTVCTFCSPRYGCCNCAEPAKSCCCKDSSFS